jgi:hypothetical protein
MSSLDPLQIQRGCIQAPAGCGKTHLISESLKNSVSAKPILVLTHTNAAVAALRQRLDKSDVPRSNYRLATIDGWSMRLVGMFPARSGVEPDVLQLTSPSNDYPKIKASALTLLRGHHIDDLISANYSRLLVDEYQDCLMTQHSIVCELAQILPTCVFGDVLQGIFDFGDDPVDWNTGVLSEFPLAGELATPWRWDLCGASRLGQWLLSIRPILQAGGQIDLKTAPPELEWVQISGPTDFDPILKATQFLPKGFKSSLIICEGKGQKGRLRQQDIARKTAGANVVENADLTDLISFSQKFDFQSKDAAENLIQEAGKLMRGINASELKKRYASLVAKTATKAPSEPEEEILAFGQNPTPKQAAAFLSILTKQSGVSAFRTEVLRNMLKALNACSSAEDFHEMVVRAREERRFNSRVLGRRSVGSTLLVKGLEADQAVIVDSDQMNFKNLYVALTRGAKRVVVCSTSSVLP